MFSNDAEEEVDAVRRFQEGFVGGESRQAYLLKKSTTIDVAISAEASARQSWDSRCPATHSIPSTYFGTAVMVLKDPLTSAALTNLVV